MCMEEQLLCTFTDIEHWREIVNDLIENILILNNKIIVISNIDDRGVIYCIYNIDGDVDCKRISNTILIHRKKNTNTLYTINALNEIIKLKNGGLIDKKYDINWVTFKNSIIIKKDDRLVHNKTELLEVIRI